MKVRDTSSPFKAQRRVYWFILIGLTSVLAVGFPVAGFRVVDHVRMILFAQVIHDNDVISQLFEFYLRSAYNEAESREVWLNNVRLNANPLIEADRGYICLIDSDANLRVASFLEQDSRSLPLDSALLFPFIQDSFHIDHDNPIPVADLLKSDDTTSLQGLFQSQGINQYVDFRKIEIDGENWLIGVHQYEPAVQSRLQQVYQFILIVGFLLFIAIVFPFAIFSWVLIDKHEQERSAAMSRMEDHAREIGQYNQRLQESNHLLQTIQQQKNRLYARLSHDLRTPLNSILSACSMVADGMYGPVNEKQQQSMHTVDRNVQVLLQLTDSILQLARIEDGTLSMNITTVDLVTLMEDLRENLLPIAREKQLSLECDLSAPSCTVSTDRDKLYLILQNITGNAIRYTQTGSVTLHLHRVEHSVRITVRDTGPGIDEDNRERIFEAFQQGEGKQMTSPGVGLGLTISRELTQYLGGKLELESTPGVGSAFHVILPHTLESGDPA